MNIIKNIVNYKLTPKRIKIEYSCKDNKNLRTKFIKLSKITKKDKDIILKDTKNHNAIMQLLQENYVH